MINLRRYFVINGLILFIFYPALRTSTHNLNIVASLQDNQPPVVKIIFPKSGSNFEWNSTLRYSISISDKEDGESKYGEIAANEVFLEVRYYADSLKMFSEINQPIRNDAPGLLNIKMSNCLNCHAFNSKLIGPSFFEIFNRYQNGSTGHDIIAKRIREGSKGVWGNITMPAHPELSVEQSNAIVEWIMTNAAVPDIDYYAGTEGSIRIKAPQDSRRKGLLVLTATYTDHGLKDKPEAKLKGRDVSIIREKLNN